MATLGYARVSTRDQDYEGQIEALKAEGCEVVFREKISGEKAANRPQLAKLLKALQPGDVVLIAKLDRLARSTRDLLNILHEIGERGAAFKSLGDAWADTTTPHGRLMLTILGGLAEFERELIRRRTGEGRTRAMQRGVKFGRKPKLTKHQQREVIARIERGDVQADIARSLNVSEAMISRLAAREAA